MTIFTERYIMEYIGGEEIIAEGDIEWFIQHKTGDYDFIIWHIQADVPPRNVTEDLIAKYAPEADDGSYARHVEQERHGWEQV